MAIISGTGSNTNYKYQLNSQWLLIIYYIVHKRSVELELRLLLWDEGGEEGGDKREDGGQWPWSCRRWWVGLDWSSLVRQAVRGVYALCLSGRERNGEKKKRENNTGRCYIEYIRQCIIIQT